jgi:hypothetical protein
MSYNGAKRAIPVADQIARRRIPGECFSDLARNPCSALQAAMKASRSSAEENRLNEALAKANFADRANPARFRPRDCLCDYDFRGFRAPEMTKDGLWLVHQIGLEPFSGF